MAATSAADHGLVTAVRAALAQAGDPAVAVQQQAYMKSAMPYHELPAPRLKAVLRPLLGPWRPDSRQEWFATIRALWDEATHREEWYAAITVARGETSQGVHARTDPDWVRAEVARLGDRPSGLSRREATKHL